MKSVVLAVLLILPSLSLAESLDEHITKMAKVVAKDGRCALAVAAVPYGKQAGREDLMPNGTTCAGDVVLEAGTMNEKRGCAVFYLNAYDLKTHGVLKAIGVNRIFMVQKECDKGGFEELIKMRLSPRDDLVKNAFLESVSMSSEDVKQVFVYGKSKYQSWFAAEQAKFQASQNEKGRAATKRSVATDNK